MLESLPDIMTIKDVTQVLHCGRSKILDYIHDGVLAAYRPTNKKWLILKEDLIEFIVRT